MALNKTPKIQSLLEKAKILPKSAGCYLFYSASNEVIYVGKAKNLNARVTSYFTSDHSTSPKTRYLVEKIQEIKFELTGTDAEAFILENNLIKKYSPKYNIRLKDDKSYPYIIVDKKDEFPLIEFRRRAKKDKNSEIFGPFVHGSNVYEVLRAVNKAFSLRDCSKHEFNSRKNPCLLYQMHHCTAPCVDKITQTDYQKDLTKGLDIFRGKGDKSLRYLKNQMSEHAEREEFEVAARLRDSIGVIEEFVFKFQDIASKESSNPESVDIIGYHVGNIEIDITIGMIREGVYLGHKDFWFPLNDFQDNDLEDELLQFYFQYLISSKDTYPKSILISGIDAKSPNAQIFKESIESEIKQKVQLDLAKKFKDSQERLLALSTSQAEENQRLRELNKQSYTIISKHLKELLGLRESPRMIECYDVAVWQGKSPTASQIVFFDGQPEKSSYRHYHLKELAEGNNDFAMMKEVLERRLKNFPHPDLIIVDGGKGQLGVAEKVIKDMGLKIAVSGIAKAKTKGSFNEKEVSGTEERLFIPNVKDPKILKKGSALYRLITQMRDEAHRFSRRLHHHKEKGKLMGSWLDQVPGIGPKTKSKILEKLDLPRQEIQNFSVDEIQQKLDVSKKIAEKIFYSLKGE